MLLAIKASGIPLHRWVDDIGDAGTVDTSPRRIQAPAYAGKNVAQSGLSDGPLAGEGALQIARQQAASNAATAGCDVVTKNTTILAAGDQNLRPTKGQEKCSKHRKAESMIANGATIPIVVETDFMLMVQ